MSLDTQCAAAQGADSEPGKGSDILNIAGYKFIDMAADSLPAMRAAILQRALQLQLKGTVLLAAEGINLYVAGNESDINSFISFLGDEFTGLDDISYKRSWSEHRPYTRMLVRIKNETISFGVDEVAPLKQTAPHLSPQELHSWYRQGKQMLVLDTRNDYEVKLGTFKDAVDFNIRTFKQFIAKVDAMDEADKQQPVVTFCTGGIRCEKAAEYMQQQGFEQVYQLDGGILNYFEQCGGDYYNGDCFVFDKRVALNSKLQVTDAEVCYSCRMPLLPGDFDPEATACPLCGKSRFGKADFAKDHPVESAKQA